MRGKHFMQYLLFLALAFLASPAYAESGHHAHWAYDGKEGPAAWGSLTEEYATCAAGKAQSPVDIRDAKPATLPLIGTDYPATGLKIINNGHTVQVNHGAGGAASLGGKRYNLAQFHFHAPSEHKIDGKAYPMEVHLVHKDANGGLAVIGVMFKLGNANPFLAKFWDKLPKQAGPEQSADLSIDSDDLLPKDKSYFHYAGSLTTPPCSEGVKWYVLKNPVEASAEQIRQFAALFGHNERPVQPLNGREISFVNDTGEAVAVPPAFIAPPASDSHDAASATHDDSGHAQDTHASPTPAATVTNTKPTNESSSMLNTLGYAALGLVVVAALLFAVHKSGEGKMNLTVAQRIYALIAVALLGLLIQAGVGYQKTHTVYEKTNFGNVNVVPSIQVLDRTIYEFGHIRVRTYRHVLNTDPAKMAQIEEKIHEAKSGVEKALKEYESLITNEEDKRLLEMDKAAYQEYIKGVDHILDLSRANRHDEARDLLTQYAASAEKFNSALEDHMKLNDVLGEQVAKEGAEAMESATTISLITVVIVITIVGFMGWQLASTLARQLGGEPGYAANVANLVAAGDLTVEVQTKPGDTTSLLASLKDMVEKLSSTVSEIRVSANSLTSASEEISATAQSLSQSANEQAASVEETSASVEQMSASVNQNSENAKVTEGIAAKAAHDANDGGEAVRATVDAMKSIADKIGIIDDIAYQTNLLALNAAIEAARAGEHGKGFAVVAAEVRKLAERSQVAAQEIGETAKGSVGLAEKAGKLLEEMVPNINKTSDLVQEITAASEEQSSGVGQINTAMGQMSQITQQNASASEELAATAEEMNASAEQLQQLVSYFTIDDEEGGPVVKASTRAAKPVSRKKAAKVSQFNAEPDESEFVKF